MLRKYNSQIALKYYTPKRQKEIVKKRREVAEARYTYYYHFHRRNKKEERIKHCISLKKEYDSLLDDLYWLQDIITDNDWRDSWKVEFDAWNI